MLLRYSKLRKLFTETQRKIGDVRITQNDEGIWVIAISPVSDVLPGVRKWRVLPSYTSYILVS